MLRWIIRYLGEVVVEDWLNIADGDNLHQDSCSRRRNGGIHRCIRRWLDLHLVSLIAWLDAVRDVEHGDLRHRHCPGQEARVECWSRNTRLKRPNGYVIPVRYHIC